MTHINNEPKNLMIEMTEISRENNAKFMLTKCQTHQGQTLYEIKNIVLFSCEVSNFIFRGQIKSIICDKT